MLRVGGAAHLAVLDDDRLHGHAGQERARPERQQVPPIGRRPLHEAHGMVGMSHSLQCDGLL